MTSSDAAGQPERNAAAGRASNYLDIRQISKRFGSAPVLQSFDLSVARGEFITLLGPSGCGKTTLLRLIAGLLTADRGTVAIDGNDVTGLPAHRRNVGMVFQNYALFPHMSVFENVAFGLRARRMERAVIAERVGKALQLVGLEGLSDRPAPQLSGGQQQRVSLARAIVVEPSLFLFDEPFSALDRKLRERMQIEMRQILKRIGATALFVTHDQDEALVLSDRIVVMEAGRSEQTGTPAEIYAAPSTPFVLDFVGQSMQIAGKVLSNNAGRAEIETPYGRLVAETPLDAGTPLLVAVRPENVEIGSADGQENALEADVREVVYLGSKTQVIFQAGDGDRIMAEVTGPPPGVREGERHRISWPVSATLAFARRD